MPTPGNTDDSTSITEAIDMDSYRPSKQGTEKIMLAEDPGQLAPIPVNVRGGKTDPEFDNLENILNTFNQRFGDVEWTDKDKVNKILLRDLPADMQADAGTVDAIRHSDRQNAKIASDKKLEELMQQYLFTQTEIFKKFTKDADFQRRYKEFVFDTLWNAHKAENEQNDA